MEGYLKSKMKGWMHIFKMSVRPGGEVPLSVLYEMYGKKHKIAKKDFVAWLKEVKLKGKLDDWLIVEKDSQYVEEKSSKVNNIDYETNNSGEVVKRQLSVEDVVGLPVRKARDIVPTIMDAKLLKYALAEARPRSNKESLIRILEKRINELNLVA